MTETPDIGIADGRDAFGADPAGYAAHRPDYPARVYDVLRERCGLGPGVAAFEIGPATGLVTRRLAAAGARPIVAVEPDRRLADYLARDLREVGALDVRVSAFEDVSLEPAGFDLGVAATAFHWLEQRTALRKVARALRPGGFFAMWWTVFGDPRRPDPFHDATKSILERLGRSPSAGVGGIWPFALQRDERLADLSAEGLFDDVDVEEIPTTLALAPDQVRGLYATFSSISRLPAGVRDRLLDALVRVAREEFGGRVERNLVSVLYTARRTGAGAAARRSDR